MNFLKLLLSLYARPLAALNRIIDEGNWAHGALAVIAVSGLVWFALARPLYQIYEAVPLSDAELFLQLRARVQVEMEDEDTTKLDPAMIDELARRQLEAYRADAAEQSSLLRSLQTRRLPLPLVGDWGWWFVSFSMMNVLSTLVGLALFYVPGATLLLVLIDYLGSFSVVLRRDYGALLSCTLLSWAAAHLPFALLGLILAGKLSGPVLLGLWAASKLAFGLLMTAAFRTIFGVSWFKALAVASVAWVSMLVTTTIISFASSSLLLMLWLLPLGFGAYAAFRASYSQQRSFRRSLEAATLNPRDAEAHYQLGLIYRQRRQLSAALDHFRKAVEIDPKEIDANYQLGQIAREQQRLQDAIQHFSVVVAQNPKYAQHEIWREVGATYLAAGMLTEARENLERFVAHREFDPEGLYHLGETWERLGDAAKAREFYERCQAAEASMPHHRRRDTRKWGQLARKKL